MKKKKGILISTALVLVLALAVVILVNVNKTGETEEKVIVARSYEGNETTYVLEDDALKFELDSTNTHFTVTNKKTGYVWYSNPEGIENDPIALFTEKEKLQSTILLTYSTKNGVDTVYNNYAYGITGHMYEIEQGNDYIKVLYSIGDAVKEFVIPPVIEEARMQAILDQLTKTEASSITSYYKKYDINNLGKKDNKDELLERYPIMETEIVYVLRDTTKDNMKKKMESLFEKAGYTPEEWQEDLKQVLAVTVSEKPVFNLSVIYRLENSNLVVEVPLNEIEYKEKYPVYNICILPYFGAGGAEDEGYMLVPEGGGAIINFNNGKTLQGSYYSNLYGWDYAQERKALVHETAARFNAFGVARNGESFVCTIDGGASYAGFQASTGGRLSTFNSVNVEYNVLHRNNYDVGSRTTAQMYVYEDSLPDEVIRQTYHFVNSDSYVDMAKCYGEYLLNRDAESFVLNTDNQAPVCVEIIGAVDKIKQVLGVPTSRPHKLTTYTEALEIVKELKENGFENMSVKFTGWMNGGVEHSLLNKVSLIGDLGSKKNLKNFINTSKELEVDVYLDGMTNYAYNSNIFDGFVPFVDAAKFVSDQRAKLYGYNTVSYEQMTYRNPYYLLKASEIWKMADNLVKAAEKYDAGVSFRDYGNDLSADYNEDELVTRQASMLKQTEQLKEYTQSNNVMINKGNDYAIAYADIVTNMELGGYDYNLIDKEVPFYQIAIHGYVNYTGESLNLCQNFEDELLKSAEYGAGLSFTFMKETAFELQSTYYTKYFGADFSAWSSKAVEIYNRYNAELGNIFNMKITDHEVLSDTLTCTTYEDGTKVYVNYDFVDAYAKGVKVPARDYKVVK